MDDKDSNPFGYTFDEFSSPNLGFENNGPPLLDDPESQALNNFFSRGPFSPGQPLQTSDADTKDPYDIFNWDSYPAPSVLEVSSTLPDITPFQHGFLDNHTFDPHSHSGSHLAGASNDMQAMPTFPTSTAQIPQAQGRSYSLQSLHSLPPSTPTANGHPMPSYHSMPGVPTVSSFQNMHPPNGLPNGLDFMSTSDSLPMTSPTSSLPLVPTSRGLMNEQLAAVLPNHDDPGTIDAHLAAQFLIGDARQRPELQLYRRGSRPSMPRTYTYGTDNAFTGTAFQVSSHHDTEQHVVGRLMQDLRAAGDMDRHHTDTKDARPGSSNTHQSSQGDEDAESASEDEQQLNDETSGEESDNRPTKRRRKSTNGPKKPNGKTTATSQTNGAKSSAKKGPLSGDVKLSKKRNSKAAAAHERRKSQRENLTEAQKRENHIQSEQRRRHLIQDGFKQLAELVPGIRNSGLSKAQRLVEAADFLDRLVADNEQYKKLMGGAG